MELEKIVDPIQLFKKWLSEAEEKEIRDPNAMQLATVNKDGMPSVRTVLLKDIIDGDFVFYTNYQSAKAEELEYQNKASLVFWWISQERQVRIEGFTEKVTESESEAYFATRPRESQLSAWASDQSKPVSGRPELETKMTELRSNFSDPSVPKPKEWGGYRLIPSFFEFGQGREDRLHDRICYLMDSDQWKIQRLSP